MTAVEKRRLRKNELQRAAYAKDKKARRAYHRAAMAAQRTTDAEKFRARDRLRYLLDPRRVGRKKPTRSKNEADRRARKLKQRCVCCTDAQIASVYALAQLLGDEVDHRTPLALGGWHCARNLQNLTKAEHAAKTKQDQQRIAAVRVRSRLLRNWR